MKFSNGYWLMKEGVTPHYAKDLFEYTPTADGLRAVVASTPMRARGDTLNSTVITINVTAPMPDVIGVEIRHFYGDVPGHRPLELYTEPVTPETVVDGRNACFTSGDLTLKMYGDEDFRMDFIAEGRVVSSAAPRACGYFIDANTGRNYTRGQLSVGVGESIYGLGERFTPFVKNGQVVDIWQADGGTSSEQSYKNVPFYLSNKGYGVFVNDLTDVSFEVCSEDVERVGFSAQGESLQYFFIYGRNGHEILERYTALTGRPALPPAWSFGLWLSTSFTTDYDENTVNSFIDGMAERNIPLSVFHFDCFWMRGNHWIDFEWDKNMFPDPEGMLRRLKAKGLKLCIWINSYVAQASSLFPEAAEKGYLLKKTDGTVWQTDLWQSGMGIVDFTNPEAVKWYQGHLEKLMDMGIDCFKTDFGERIPVRDIAWYDGSDPLEMHNRYTLLYNKVVFDLLERKRGRNEAVVFARSAYAGGQQMPVHWGGDNTATYPSMAETLRGGLSLAACGFGFWSHDIGGFEDTAPADVYKRWCAFGLLSSHSRLHGSGSYRVPWNFDDEASDVLRRFVNLKCSLMPYIYTQAVYAHKFGTPVMRPMVVEFMDDPACAYLDRQYMLGGSLLVAPVFDEGGKAQFYVPQGRWTDLLNGRTYEGGRYYDGVYDFFALPLLVRPGTILPVGADDTRPDYDYHKGLTLKVFELDDGDSSQIEIYDMKGENPVTVNAFRRGGRVTVTADRPLEGVKLEYVGDGVSEIALG